jgi:hypothetical protein
MRSLAEDSEECLIEQELRLDRRKQLEAMALAQNARTAPGRL